MFVAQCSLWLVAAPNKPNALSLYHRQPLKPPPQNYCHYYEPARHGSHHRHPPTQSTPRRSRRCAEELTTKNRMRLNEVLLYCAACRSGQPLSRSGTTPTASSGSTATPTGKKSSCLRGLGKVTDPLCRGVLRYDALCGKTPPKLQLLLLLLSPYGECRPSAIGVCVCL